ncbi:MAG: protein kinase [Anaerolineae bacterium]|nr:protein kinase [Anaerolineae bacterium]
MSSVNFLLGKTLGKYEVLEHVGHGGMAEVYKGQHVQLDRMVAVKVLHPFLADEEGFVVRFQREARIVATLRHPNIVQVYDFDYNDELNIYYMVMEYIDGPTLKSILSEGLLPQDQVLRFGAAIADAMAYAHKRGMVHRDIKPANIMFTGDHQPVLTDFGIAKMLTLSGLTASGAMVGTPAYMAPEVGMGKAGTASSDIYSLGVVLYQMLSGKLPFESESPMGMVMQHINDPPPPISKMMPSIPPELEAAILRSLEKQPENRYKTADEMAHDLRKLAGIDTPNSIAVPTMGQGDAAALLRDEMNTPISLTTPPLTPKVPYTEYDDDRLLRTWPPQAVTPLSAVITPDNEKRRGKKKQQGKDKRQAQPKEERRRPFLVRAFRAIVMVLILLVAAAVGWAGFGGYIPPQIAAYLPPSFTPIDLKAIDWSSIKLPSFGGQPTPTATTDVQITVTTTLPVDTPTPTDTPTVVATATRRPPPTAVPTPTPIVELAVACNYRIKLNQLIFDPGDVVAPESAFVVYLALSNNGDCPWTEGLRLEFVSGEQMNAPAVVPIQSVAPRAGAQVILPMLAPTEPGDYESRWEIKGANNEPFGSAIFIRVTVNKNAPAPERIPTPVGATPTPRTPLTLSEPILAMWQDDVANKQWSGTLLFKANAGAGQYQYYLNEIRQDTVIPNGLLTFVWQRCKSMPVRVWVISGDEVMNWEGLIAYPSPEQCQ